MKKYIIPDTQIIGMIQPSILCGSNDGIDPNSGAQPTPPSGKPGGAPKRVFF